MFISGQYFCFCRFLHWLNKKILSLISCRLNLFPRSRWRSTDISIDQWFWSGRYIGSVTQKVFYFIIKTIKFTGSKYLKNILIDFVSKITGSDIIPSKRVTCTSPTKWLHWPWLHFIKRMLHRTHCHCLEKLFSPAQPVLYMFLLAVPHLFYQAGGHVQHVLFVLQSSFVNNITDIVVHSHLLLICNSPLAFLLSHHSQKNNYSRCCVSARTDGSEGMKQVETMNSKSNFQYHTAKELCLLKDHMSGNQTTGNSHNHRVKDAHLQ